MQSMCILITPRPLATDSGHLRRDDALAPSLEEQSILSNKINWLDALGGKHPGND